MVIAGLTFVMTNTDHSGSVDVPVLEFTATSATLAGITLTGPCSGLAQATTAWAIVNRVPTSASVTLGGSVTLDASSFTYTQDGTTFTYDASTAPARGTVLVINGTVSQVSITATKLAAASVTENHMVTATEAC